LYFTTYPKKSHLRDILDCWPGLLQKSHLLNSADILVYLAGAASDHKLIANWRAALHALSLGNKRKATLHLADNPGYQEGAMKAMDQLLQKGWGDGYDWVIRLNPDVLIYDDNYLDLFFRSSHLTSVLANCSPHMEAERAKVMTDFLAFRPGHLFRDAFADWRVRKNAEWQASSAFKDMILNRTCAWLVPRHDSPSCRTRGNGVYHHETKHNPSSTCTAVMREQPWKLKNVVLPAIPA
jgi:hypothetical protein